jgi:predicted permease
MRRIPGLRRVFRHERGTDVDVELQFHIDQRTEDLVRQGLAPSDARRTALAEFGDVKRYEAETRRIDRGHARVTRVKELLWSVWSDLVYTLRGLHRSPGFAAAAIVTIALGVGANTAVWTILDALMRRPLPIERPNELHAARRSDRADGGEYQHSFLRFQRLKAVLPEPARLGAMSAFAGMYATTGDQPEPVVAQLVSGNWFGLLGVGASAGRTLLPDDEQVADGSPMAVLSDGYWTRRFARDPRVVGTAIRLNGVPVRVVGVAEQGFQGLTVGQPVDVWLPLAAQGPVRYMGNMSATDADLDKPWLPQDGISWLTLVARVTPAEAARVAGALDRQLRRELEQRAAAADSTERAFAMREHLALDPIPRGLSPLRERFREPLRVLMASVGLVFVIVCANLAGLLLARGAARGHELAVRVSLGARPRRLVRQVLTESVTIALLGGALSLVVAHWGTAMLLRAASSGAGPIPLAVSIDGRVLGFALALSVLTGLIVGGLPALRVSRARLHDAFRMTGRVVGASGGHRVPLGRVLVVSQIALSLVLVATAGMFVRTLRNLLAIDPGYERAQLITARLDVRAAGYDSAQLPVLYDRLVSRAAAVPGVRSASLSVHGLAGSVGTSGFVVPGRTFPPAGNSAQQNFVTPDYFATVGMPLVEGRAFTPADRAGGPRVAVVTESMARHFFGTTEVVGSRLGHDAPTYDIEIVGVVRDARVNALRETPPRVVYFALAQRPQEYVNSLEVRVAGRPEPVLASLRAAIRDASPEVPVREIVTVADLLERGLSRERVVARLAGSFGVLALLLAGIGLYGVMGYSVSRRTNEMGVRLALGASPGGVRLLVLRESLVLAGAGLVVGLVLLLPVQGLTGRLVYGVSPRDPVTVAVATGVLLLVTAVAAFVPAWRASRIDPVEAIRSA